MDEGSTVTDFDPDEVDRKISRSAPSRYGEWKKNKVNLLDAPGYPTASPRPGPPCASGRALVVVDAVSGSRVQTEKVWGYPRITGSRASSS